MASTVALRGLVAASVGLGVADLIYLNLALAPAALATARPEPAPEPVPVAAPAAVAVVTPAPAAPAEPPAPPPRLSAAVDPTPAPTEPVVDPAPAPAATPPPAPIPAPAIVLGELREQVFFASTSATLDDTARTTLASVLARRAPDAPILLFGHTDERGDEDFNRSLRKQRAKAVASQLRRLGVSRSLIRIDFSGEREARAAEPAEQWRDRRVEIHFTGGKP